MVATIGFKAQVLIFKMYLAAQRIHPINKHVAAKGGHLDQALNWLMGYDDRAQRLRFYLNMCSFPHSPLAAKKFEAGRLHAREELERDQPIQVQSTAVTAECAALRKLSLGQLYARFLNVLTSQEDKALIAREILRKQGETRRFPDARAEVQRVLRQIEQLQRRNRQGN